MTTPIAICEPDPTLRRRMGVAAAAAGFTVTFPDYAAQWATGGDGVVLLTVLTRDQLSEVQRVKEACPTGTVVVLLNALEPTLVRAALRAGAGSVLSRSADPRDVLSAVRLARGGNAVLPRQILHNELKAATPDLTPSLEDDDLELLRYLADGATVQRIARQRHQATRTVERHLCRLYSRFGAQDRMQAVGTAIQMGLIRMPARQVRSIPTEGE